jgi:putative ABC transport system ATP-binding protein/macrolide transport system ATP-binding/permease protein/lipoprotein-releasing system ATP-binding protein
MLLGSNLCKTYGDGPRRVEAVRDATLQVHEGEFLALVGRSGSGKSTLLAMLGGLCRPTEGTVRLGDQDLWALRDSVRSGVLSRNIGFVFQFASLLPTLRAVDNVALPALMTRALPANKAYRRAELLLHRVGLQDRLEAYPGELSGGEQRRVALARALILSPPILLADEPTADLDEQTEAEMLAVLLELHRSERLTLVVVTHNPGIAAHADRVLEMRQGQLVTSSRPVPVRSLPAPVGRAIEAELPAAVAAVRLGQGLRRFATACAGWSLLVLAGLLACNQAVALYQRHRVAERQEARRLLELTALSSLRADVEDVTAARGHDYEVTLYLANATAGKPIYVMSPIVRAYVQVGPVWQEVPLRPADGQDEGVRSVTQRQLYRYVFTPDVPRFEELLPGYMHVRFTNSMIVSQRSNPADDLFERTDNYFVYLKPPAADDAAIARKLRFPGQPPVWIPMPPH